MLCGCVLLCSLWGITMGVPPALTLDNSDQAIPTPVQQQLIPVDTLIKRDYKAAPAPAPAPAPVAGDAGISSYSGGGNSRGGYVGGGTDLGQYYYYYPVQEEQASDVKDGSGQDHVLYQPAIIIIILLAMILLQLSLPGIIASLARLLPTFVIEPFTIPVLNNGRDLTDTQFLSWEKINNLTTSVRSAIESEECLPRLICYSAHYADGSKALLSLLEDVPSEGYSSYVKMFKDSALRKADCNIYKCGTLGSKD